MDRVQCSGDEETLADCPFAGWGIANCNPCYVVFLVCSNAEDQGVYNYEDFILMDSIQ